MYQKNPNRIQLLDFINTVNKPRLKSVERIEDLSSGVHYIFVLMHLESSIVKISRVNEKAFHEH